MTRNEKAILLTAVSLWLGLFTAGILENTTNYRNLITYHDWLAPNASDSDKQLAPKSPPTRLDRAIAWPIVLVAYSVPNLLYLCILASVMGAFLRRTGDSISAGPIANTLYRSALAGFLLYLSFMAGLVTIASANEFVAPNQDTYIRRAPVLSVICFMLAYEPKLLELLLERLRRFSQSTISSAERSGRADSKDKDSTS